VLRCFFGDGSPAQKSRGSLCGCLPSEHANIFVTQGSAVCAISVRSFPTCLPEGRCSSQKFARVMARVRVVLAVGGAKFQRDDEYYADHYTKEALGVPFIARFNLHRPSTLPDRNKNRSGVFICLIIL